MIGRNNVTLSDTYKDSATIEQPGTVRVVLEVSIAPCFYQLLRDDRNWDDEVYASRNYSLARACRGFRARNAQPGNNSIITVTLLEQADVS